MAEIAVLGLEVKSNAIVKADKRLAKLEKQGKRNEKQAGRLKKSYSALGGVLGAVGLGAVFKSVIGLAIEQERVVAQLDATIKSTGGTAGFTSSELQNLAASLQEVTTFGDEAIIGAQSLLLTFTKIQGEALPRTTQAVLDVSQAMGQDLKSSAIQLGKALNDPVANLGALSRTGIQFSKDQKEVIKSLQESGDLAAAQAIILEELETQFGGSAKAARDTFGGALKGLKNAFGDLLEGDGGNLTSAKDSIEDLTDVLKDPSTKAAFDDLTSSLITITAELAKAFTATFKWSTELGKTFQQMTSGGTSFEKINEEIEETEKLLRAANFQLEASSGWSAFFGVDRTKEKEEIAALNEKLAEQLEWRRTLNEEAQKAAGAAAARAAGIQDDVPSAGSGVPAAAETTGSASGVFLLKDEEIAKLAEQDLAEEERIESGLERIRNRNKTEFELMEERYLNEKDLLKEAKELEFITEEEHAERLVGLNEERADRMNAIAQAEAQSRIGLTKSALGALESLMSTGGKKQFEIAKKAALANSIINTYQAVASGLATQPFFPVGLAMGAIALTQGLAQVKRIKSQQFGGGSTGGSSLPSVGAAAATGVTPTAEQAPPSAPSQQTSGQGGELRVVFEGDAPGSEPMRKLVENLAKTVEDMGGVSRLVIS